MPAELLQFAGSLAAILLLAWLARKLGLGRGAGELDPALIAKAAREVSDEFEPREIAIDRDGRAALVRDESGRIMLLKRHGAHFAGRILTPAASVITPDQSDPDRIEIACGERRFGIVTLNFEKAGSWAEAIEALDRQGNA